MTGEYGRIDEEALLDHLREVDALLPGLAEEEPPTELVAATLGAVRPETWDDQAEPDVEKEAPRSRRGPPRWLSIAAVLALFAGLGTVALMTTRGGPVRGLFTTADAEIDTIDSEMGGIPASRSRTPAARTRPRANYSGNQGRTAPMDSAADMGYAQVTEATPMPSSTLGEALQPPPDSREAYAHIDENAWFRVADQPRSTFSVDVDTASYANVRRFLHQGRLPPEDAVRIEELLNYFPYAYEPPARGSDVPLSVITEVGPAPWAPEHRLVHVGLQAPALTEGQVPPRNLVFLLDVSGSMNSPDKLPLLKQALALVVENMSARDTVSIVVYAGAAGVVLEPTTGSQAPAILEALEQLRAGGSTAGGAGIALAYRKARESFDPQGINRVILATDGDFNVGASSEGELVRMIERERESGVFLTVLGFGTGNLQDDRMESLADKGNGNYACIDSLAEARKVLVSEAGGTLVTVAKDVKIQVEFNPLQVQGYRLIGYENRVMANRDFSDDRKDAGEVGAGHSVTALYEVILAGGAVPAPGDEPLRYQRDKRPTKEAHSGELMTVRLRWKTPRGSRSELAEFPVRDRGLRLDATTDDFRFAASVAAWGMILRRSDQVAGFGLGDVERLAVDASRGDPGGYRAEFVELVRASGRVSLPR